MGAIFTAHITLSFLALFLNTLILPIHFLPWTITGIPASIRINTASLMLVLNTALWCIITALDISVYNGAGESVCAISALWRVYMTTVLAATLVPFALYYYSGRAWSTFKCVLLTAPAYVYATIPMFWVVGRASILGNLDRGLGVWWGTYCVPEVPMWRKVHLVTLLLPLAAAALLSLGTVVAHTESRDKPSPQSINGASHVLVLALLGIVYLSCESTVGWHGGWWGRVLEPLFCILILLQVDLLPYFQVYVFWLVGRQAPDMRDQWELEIESEHDLPHSSVRHRKSASWRWASRKPGPTIHTIAETSEPSSSMRVPAIAVTLSTPSSSTPHVAQVFPRPKRQRPLSDPFDDAKAPSGEETDTDYFSLQPSPHPTFGPASPSTPPHFRPSTLARSSIDYALDAGAEGSEYDSDRVQMSTRYSQSYPESPSSLTRSLYLGSPFSRSRSQSPPPSTSNTDEFANYPPLSPITPRSARTFGSSGRRDHADVPQIIAPPLSSPSSVSDGPAPVPVSIPIPTQDRELLSFFSPRRSALSRLQSQSSSGSDLASFVTARYSPASRPSSTDNFQRPLTTDVGADEAEEGFASASASGSSKGSWGASSGLDEGGSARSRSTTDF